MNYTQTPDNIDITAATFDGIVDNLCIVQVGMPPGLDQDGKQCGPYNYKLTCFITRRGSDLREFIQIEIEQWEPIEGGISWSHVYKSLGNGRPTPARRTNLRRAQHHTNDRKIQPPSPRLRRDQHQFKPIERT